MRKFPDVQRDVRSEDRKTAAGLPQQKSRERENHDQFLRRLQTPTSSREQTQELIKLGASDSSDSSLDVNKIPIEIDVAEANWISELPECLESFSNT